MHDVPAPKRTRFMSGEPSMALSFPSSQQNRLPHIHPYNLRSSKRKVDVLGVTSGQPYHKRKRSEHIPLYTSHKVQKDSQLFLKSLLRMASPTAILSKLNEQKFASILTSLNTSSVELALLLVKLLLRLPTESSWSVRCVTANYHLQLLLSEQSTIFFQCIGNYICSMPQKERRSDFACILSDVITLFNQLLETQPYNASSSLELPIDQCYHSAEQLGQHCQDLIFKEIQERATLLKKRREDIMRMSEESQLPTEEELQCFPKSLRKNITKGPFHSVSEYIDIFSGLLREDFIYPLREELKNKDGFIYTGVSLRCCVPIKSTSNSVLCRLNFDPVKVNWGFSKRLTYGNLLCLSEDNFNTLFFATIAERNVDDLKEHELTVSLIGKAAQDASLTTKGKVYEMFESPSYYEAYAPIMKRLESIKNEPGQLPFQKYFVEADTKIEKPLYLRSKDSILNLRDVICSCVDEKCDHSSVDVNDIQQVQLKNAKGLDESQITGLCTALTRELVLIQGPPGTGKTYIGLKIVQSLLINKSLWANSHQNVPIMVVCFTNHALDQFLEGLVEIQKCKLPSLEIRRLGGQSKSNVLEPYNIKKFFGKKCRDLNIKLKYSQKKVLLIQKQLKALQDLLDGKFQPSKRNLQLYSFLLSNKIIHELYVMCGIKTDLPNLSKKGLVLTKPQDNPYHGEIEADRQVSFDDNEAEVFEQEVYEPESLKHFVRFFKTVQPLSDDRANQMLQEEDPIEDFPHFQLFKYCLCMLRDAWQSEAERIAESDINEEEKDREQIRVMCLREADVIGVTTTGAAKYSSALTQVKSKICVIEEAAEVLEPHIISALTNHTQQLILIGDHKQLRPRLASYEVGHKYKLEVSLFERLANNNFPVVTLGVQHRMRPEIACLVSKHIYGGRLTDSSTVCKYEDIKGMQHNIFFVDHHQPEKEDQYDHSKENMHEADFVVSLSNYLLQNGYKPEEITVLTPYSGQLFCIRNKKELNKEIRVTTVDNYQGEENKIIILSMVRSNKDHRMGFTKDDNRVCVALSRAKAGFYCIGNFSMFRECSKLWKSIIEDLEQQDCKCLANKLPLQCESHKKVTLVASAIDFKNVPEGGCDKTCGIQLPACSHTCERKCHAGDHNTPCQKPCEKQCERYLHRCQGTCGEECPPCTVPIEKLIPSCGHKQQVPCSMPPNEFSCKVDCDKTLSCGHPCKLTCGEDCNSKPCRMFVNKKWPCGHEAQQECYATDIDLAVSFSCKVPCGETLACSHICSGTCGKCHQGRLHVPCKEKCGRKLICGHICTNCAKNCLLCSKKCLFKCSHGLCGQTGHKCSTQCKPCTHPCQWKCKHHKCKRKCGEICNRPRCNKPCKKTLIKCGHDCIGLCGEPCPDVCRVCDKDLDIFRVHKNTDARFIALAGCSHMFEVTYLDDWVDHRQSKIDWIRCPECDTPIFTTCRYVNRIKEVQRDINLVKTKNNCLLTEEERKNYIDTISSMTINALAILEDQKNSLHRSLKVWLNKVKIIELEQISDAMLECTCVFTHSIFEALRYTEIFSDDETFTHDELLKNKISVLNAQILQLLKWIESCLQYQPFTDQIFEDLVCELRRITLLGEFYICSIYNPSLYHSLGPEHSLLQQIQEYECLGNKPSGKVMQKFFKALTELYALFGCSSVLPSKRKRFMITIALHPKPAGSWFQM